MSDHTAFRFVPCDGNERGCMGTPADARILNGKEMVRFVNLLDGIPAESWCILNLNLN